MSNFLTAGDTARLRAFFTANAAIVSVELENGITCPRWLLKELDDAAAAAWLNEAYGRVAS